MIIVILMMIIDDEDTRTVRYALVKTLISRNGKGRLYYSINFLFMFLLNKEQSYVCTYNYNVIKKEENKNQTDSDHELLLGPSKNLRKRNLINR